MKILKSSYAETRQRTLDNLDAYYREVLQIPEDPTPTPNPYEDQNNEISFEAHSDEGLIGGLVGEYDPMTNSVRIELLHVDAKSRGMNVGARLIEAFETDARAKGVQMSFVDTTSSSAPKFYEKQGYQRIGEVSDYPVEGETYLLYRKSLKQH